MSSNGRHRVEAGTWELVLELDADQAMPLGKIDVKVVAKKEETKCGRHWEPSRAAQRWAHPAYYCEYASHCGWARAGHGENAPSAGGY